jgi:hypothetical protein
VRGVVKLGLTFYRAERGREVGGRGDGGGFRRRPPLMVVARWMHRCAGISGGERKGKGLGGAGRVCGALKEKGRRRGGGGEAPGCGGRPRPERKGRQRKVEEGHDRWAHLSAGGREREGMWASGIGKTGRIGLVGRLDCGNRAGGFRWVGGLG